MLFQPQLTTATLIKRYKRFLADVKLDDGTTITVHCPNTGSMLSCSTPGSRVAISTSDNPKRKYPNTLEMVMDNNTWVGVNTSLTNSLVADAILNEKIDPFKEVVSVKREVKVSNKSRLDLMVEHSLGTTYVEIKNCSLAVNGCAMFPDAVTTRGSKHLTELMQLVEDGSGGCIFMLVQRMDAERFAPADQIDSVYGETLREAVRQGVQLLVYQAEVSPAGIELVRPLPVTL